MLPGGTRPLALLLLAACSDPDVGRLIKKQARHRTESHANEPAHAPLYGTERSLYVRAGRCGECHEQMYSEWQGSPHATATRSAAYQRSLGLMPETVKKTCHSCHVPGWRFGEHTGTEERPSEGVSCDPCHTISKVVVEGSTASLIHDPGSGKKYGPIPGASGHYFHDMAYSELHTRSELCAGCHHLMSFTFGGKTRNIPVVTDYTGWKRTDMERSCQDCHMPATGTRPVARGARPRPQVPSHAIAPVGGARAVRVEASMDQRHGVLTLELTHGAGHSLPSGLADRRLVLEVRFLDGKGDEVAREERRYGIRLADEEGRPAPFFAATQVVSDERLAPGRTREEVFHIPAPVQAEVTRAAISLYSERTAKELASFYGPPERVTRRILQLPLPRVVRSPRSQGNGAHP